MQERLRRWFPFQMYTDPIAQYRATGTYAAAAVIAVATGIGILVIASMLIGGANLHSPILATVLVGDGIMIVLTPIIIVFTPFQTQALAPPVIPALLFPLS